MRVIGLDPGTARLGWGVIDVTDGAEQAVAYGCIETAKTLEAAGRLLRIHLELRELLAELKPDAAVVEKLFFAKNQTTAMAVAEARGVLLLALGERELPYAEVAPRQVKLSLTGDGTADKKQMQLMVTRLLGLDEIPRPDDAADGLALALVGWRLLQI